MSTFALEMRATLRRLTASLVLHVTPVIPLTMTGSLKKLQGDVVLDSDQVTPAAPFITLADPLLIGARFLVQGPGDTILTGTDSALVIIDATARGSLRLAGSRAMPAPVLALQSAGGYALAICGDAALGRRWLVICELSFDLPVLVQTELTTGDFRSWIAARDGSDPVFAYPDGEKIVLCNLDGTFEEITSLHGGPLNGVKAAWVDLVHLERPDSGGILERLHYLVVAREHDGTAAIYEQRTLYADPASRLPILDDRLDVRLRQVSAVELEDAEVPLSLTAQPAPLFARGSTTSPDPVEPIFDGVVILPDGRRMLSWGYDNPNDDIVYIPAGVNNQIGSYTGVPEQFFPGRVYAAVSIIVPGSEPAVSWALEALTEPADYNDFLVADYDPRDRLIYIPRDIRPVLDVFTLSDPDAGPTQRDSYSLAAPVTDAVRDTLLPNEDVPGISRWWQRYATARIAGGWLMVHGPIGRVSRVYRDDFARELE